MAGHGSPIVRKMGEVSTMIACAHGVCMTRTCCLRVGCASMTSFPFILDTSSYSVVGESSMFGHCGWPPTSEFDCVSALVRRVLGSTARHHLAADEMGDDHIFSSTWAWSLVPLSLSLPLSVARPLRGRRCAQSTDSLALVVL